MTKVPGWPGWSLAVARGKRQHEIWLLVWEPAAPRPVGSAPLIALIDSIGPDVAPTFVLQLVVSGEGVAVERDISDEMRTDPETAETVIVLLAEAWSTIVREDHPETLGFHGAEE